MKGKSCPYWIDSDKVLKSEDFDLPEEVEVIIIG